MFNTTILQQIATVALFSTGLAFGCGGSTSTDASMSNSATSNGIVSNGSTSNGATSSNALSCMQQDFGFGPIWTGTVNGTFSGDEPAPLVGITDVHNHVRRSVGVPELAWSNTLASDAQAWADGLAGMDCALVHDRSGGFGENLWMAFSSAGLTVDPAEVVGDWSCESKDWDNDAVTCGGQSGYGSAPGCGHYTQVTWRQTTELGCGTATCDGGNSWVTVCRYTPAGNNGSAPY